jgi:hypothetical protein
MSTVPRLTYRYDRFTELLIRNRPGVRAYQVGAADTMNNAFAGSNVLFTVDVGRFYQSKSIRHRKLGRNDNSTLALTICHLDFEDFWQAGGSYPHDADVAFVRVQEVDAAGNVGPEGPILIVPPPGFFVTTRPNLTVSATAPNVAALTTNLPPPGVLRFVLPRFADAVTVANTSGNSLFISFHPGLPEFEVASNSSFTLPDAAVSEVFVRGNGAAVPFTMYFAIVNAEMA